MQLTAAPFTCSKKNFNPKFLISRVLRLWVVCDEDGFYLQIVADSFFAIDASARTAGNPLSTIWKAVGVCVVAVNLAGAVTELLGNSLTQF